MIHQKRGNQQLNIGLFSLCLAIFSPSLVWADTCQAALDSYYQMSLAELLSIKKDKKSRVEKRAYKQVVREAKVLESNNVNFSVEEDDFTGDKTYRTNLTKPIFHKKSTCDEKNKLVKGYARKGSASVFFRKICKRGQCAPLQAYFVYTTMGDNAMSRYYGINRAVVKGMGDVEFTTIDIDFDVGTYGTTYTFHMTANFNASQVTELVSAEEDAVVRFYSNAGSDIDLSIPHSQITAFYDGLLSTNAL